MKYRKIPIENTSGKCGGGSMGGPYLRAYLLDESEELLNSRERPAVVICPGGAYRFLSDREAEPVAMRFLGRGMQAFVLYYSVAPAKFPCALVELAISVSYIREHAEEWHIDKERIFLCGFSAGGHLCASLGTLHSRTFLRDILCGEYKREDGSWKPDGMILSYPVISLGKYTHAESRENLVGCEPDEGLVALASLEKQVSEATVPTFLWHTRADEEVPVENSLLFAEALAGSGVSFELHIYEKGGHGLSLCDSVTESLSYPLCPENAGWFALAVDWIGRRREKGDKGKNAGSSQEERKNAGSSNEKN